MAAFEPAFREKIAIGNGIPVDALSWRNLNSSKTAPSLPTGMVGEYYLLEISRTSGAYTRRTLIRVVVCRHSTTANGFGSSSR